MSVEEDFKKVYEEGLVRLKAKNQEALKVMHELETICEETGIPFYASVSPLGQTYQPNSFQDKWGSLLEEDVLIESKYGNYHCSVFDKITNEASRGEYEGWQHSAVCY